MIRVRGKPIVPGDAEGEAVVVEALSFYGEVDPEKGTLKDGRSIVGKILVLGRSRGSTVGSYIVYALKQNGLAPKAIVIAGQPDAILITGAVISGIPLIQAESRIMEMARDGMKVKVSGSDIFLYDSNPG